jgi:probable HAF family extracellular repeat protein
VSRATDVNDRSEIVGLTPAPGISARAVRWGLDGRVTGLGPLPLSLSEALGINNDGMSAGFADVADGSIHATVWDRAGNVTDLGTLGGIVNIALHINERSQVAGIADRPGSDEQMGFFWSARDGMVPIDVRGGGSRLVAALNDQGELVGDTTAGDRELAYFWSRRRGVVLLPIGTGIRSDVFDVNNQAEMVGTIERPASEGGGLRAVRWPGIASPIDLNTQLYRAPAGLVLSHGAAINDKGVILAFSNAGLVLLRPGKHGTDAPVLGPMMGLPAAVGVGQQVAFTVGFVDSASGETHTASASWGDQCPATAPAVSESGGTGEVSLQHRFCAPGLFVVRVQVTDSGGRSTEILREIEVIAPALGVAGKAAPARAAGVAEAAQKARLLRSVRP